MPKDLVRNEEGWKKVTQKARNDFLEPASGSKPSWESLFGGQREGKKQKGRWKRKKSATQGQKGGFGKNLYLYGLGYSYDTKKKRRAPQKGGGKTSQNTQLGML